MNFIEPKVQFKLGCAPYVYKHNGDLWTDLDFDYSLYNYSTERKLVAYTDNFKTYTEKIKKWLEIE